MTTVIDKTAKTTAALGVPCAPVELADMQDQVAQLLPKTKTAKPPRKKSKKPAVRVRKAVIFVKLNVEPEGEHIYISSRQVPGLHLLGRSLEEIKEHVAKAIQLQLRDNEKLEVIPVWEGSGHLWKRANTLMFDVKNDKIQEDKP